MAMSDKRRNIIEGAIIAFMFAVVALTLVQRLQVEAKCARHGYSVTHAGAAPDICVDTRTGISYHPDKLG
jgi:hypothetical protein